MATKTNNVEEVVKFPKEQLLSAIKYSNRKDVLGVVLKDGKEYSFEEADILIADFMKGVK